MRWQPDHTDERTRVEPGDLINYDYAVWRVVAVRQLAECDWPDDAVQIAERLREYGLTVIGPSIVVVRPADSSGLELEHELHLEVADPSSQPWCVYRSEHYPVCVHCGEPTPCRTTVQEWEIRQEVRRIDSDYLRLTNGEFGDDSR